MDSSAYAWTGQPQTVRDLIAIWYQHFDSKIAQLLKGHYGTGDPPIYKDVPDHNEKQESCKARLLWFVEHLHKHEKDFVRDKSEEGQTLRWALERASQIVEIWAANRAHNLAMAGQGSPSATAKRVIAAYDSARLPVPEYIIAISKRKKVKAIKNQAADPEVDEFVRLPNGTTVPSDSKDALAEYARLAKDWGKPVDRTNVAEVRRNLFEKRMNEYLSLFNNADRGEVEQEDINRAVRRLFVHAKTVRYFESPQLASIALELFRLRTQAFRSPRTYRDELVWYISELIVRAQDLQKFVGNPLDWAAAAVSYCTDSDWLKQEIENKAVFVSLTPTGWQKLKDTTFKQSTMLTREEILALPQSLESAKRSSKPLIVSIPKIQDALDPLQNVKPPWQSQTEPIKGAVVSEGSHVEINQLPEYPPCPFGEQSKHEGRWKAACKLSREGTGWFKRSLLRKTMSFDEKEWTTKRWLNCMSSGTKPPLQKQGKAVRTEYRVRIIPFSPKQ